jgi:hypothetical protein
MDLAALMGGVFQAVFAAAAYRAALGAAAFLSLEDEAKPLCLKL